MVRPGWFFKYYIHQKLDQFESGLWGASPHVESFGCKALHTKKLDQSESGLCGASPQVRALDTSSRVDVINLTSLKVAFGVRVARSTALGCKFPCRWATIVYHFPNILKYVYVLWDLSLLVLFL